MTESPAKYFSLAEGEVPAPRSVDQAEWDGSAWRPVSAGRTSSATKTFAMPLMWFLCCVATVCIACSWWSSAIVSPQLEALRTDMLDLEKRQLETIQSTALASSQQVRSLQADFQDLQQRYTVLELALKDRGAHGGTSAGWIPATGEFALPASPQAADSQLPRVPVHVVLPPWKSEHSGRSSAHGNDGDSGQWPPPIRVPQAPSVVANLRPDLAGGASAAIDAAGRVLVGTSRASEAEFACQHTGRAEWTEVKALTVHQLGTKSAGLEAHDVTQLRSVLNRAMQRLQAVHGFVNECTMGRLCMSVLAVLTGDMEERSLHAAPALHTPLLTILVETPWSVIVASGWPLFALLAQLQLQTHGNDDLPPAGPEGEYFKGLWNGLKQPTSMSLATLGATFLEKGQKQRGRGNAASAVDGDSDSDIASTQELKDQNNEAELFGSHAMPILCALGSQLLGPELRGGGSAADEALAQVQSLYRQSVQSIEDLHASVISAWPLYSLLHVVALHLSGGSE